MQLQNKQICFQSSKRRRGRILHLVYDATMNTKCRKVFSKRKKNSRNLSLTIPITFCRLNIIFSCFSLLISRIISCQGEATTNNLTHAKPCITFSSEEKCHTNVFNSDILAILGQLLQEINFLLKMINPPRNAEKAQKEFSIRKYE